MAEVTIESQQPSVGYCTLNDGWELNSQTLVNVRHMIVAIQFSATGWINPLQSYIKHPFFFITVSMIWIRKFFVVICQTWFFQSVSIKLKENFIVTIILNNHLSCIILHVTLFQSSYKTIHYPKTFSYVTFVIWKTKRNVPHSN